MNRSDRHPGPTPAIPGRALLRRKVRAYRFVVEEGPDQGIEFETRAQKTSIGSHEGTDVRLGDATVSRIHCEISLTEKGAMVRDLCSRNGTFINGVRIESAYLRSGDVLTIGRTTIKCRSGEDHFEVVRSTIGEFGLLVGQSKVMQEMFARCELAAQSDATLLLEGETGTGKEAAAASIHAESARRDGPFIIVDCGSIPSELLESELFGHVKGAFTGAAGDRDGAFVEAHTGTIFLDEIGELEPELQPKLLRVLEKRHVKRVGSNGYVPVDVRVIAATHRNLEEDVNTGRFRADLFYRLAVVRIVLPSLRERPDDLLLLASHLAESMDIDPAERSRVLDSKAFGERLRAHRWPGNVRELRNYLERCFALKEISDPSTRLASPEGSGAPAADPSIPLKQAREQWTRYFEAEYLKALMDRHDGNVSAAARAAGVGRAYLHRLLGRYRS